MSEYPANITPLAKADGGGWLITYPDLPGCVSDGDTQQEAITNGADAIQSWIAANEAEGRPIPEPNSASGKFVVRLPKSIHARLVARARMEGVSLNALVQAYLSERV